MIAIDPKKEQQAPPYDLPPEEPMDDTSVLKGLAPAAAPQYLQIQEQPKEMAQTEFRTGLRLSKERVEWLMRYCFQRMDELRMEMGLTEDNRTNHNSWLGIRERNRMTFEGDMKWRLQLRDSIFPKSNLTLGTGIRHTRYLAARVQDDMVGTTPFFTAMARNASKEKLAKQVEEVLQDRIDRSTVRQGIRDAQKNAIIVNESVVKVGWYLDTSPYVGEATVMVDASGEPIKTPEKKLYIYEKDDFVPNPNVLQPGQEDPTTQQVDENGQPIPGTGQVVPSGPRAVLLEKDSSFAMTEGTFKFVKFDALPQDLVIYDGPVATPLHPACFLCPLDAETIHKADMVAHLFMDTPSHMRQRFGNIDVSQEYFEFVTADKRAKESQGEFDQPKSAVFQRGNFAEVYVRLDADQDGRDEELFVVLDIRNLTQPVFYDYLANHFKRRPFEVIVGVEKVAHRWYGRGIFSLTFDQQNHQDAEFNRANVRGSQNSQFLFRHRNACEDWANGLPAIAGGGYIHDVNPDFNEKENPPIFTVNIAPENEKFIELMDITKQAEDAIIGAISPGDASQADFNQSKTATGIVNLQAAADAITKATEQDQVLGIDAIMWQVTNVVLKHMPVKTLLVTKDTSELVELNRDEIDSLERDVRLTLSRARSTQTQQIAQTAIGIAKDFRAVLAQDPRAARDMRTLYIAQLRALEVQEADTICPEVTDEMIAQFDAQQQAAMQAQAQPPKESISVKLPDLSGSERTQALEKFGIHADEKAHDKASNDERTRKAA